MVRFLRNTVAYEDRDKETNPHNYLVDGAGNPFWGGTAVSSGAAFTVSASRFVVSDNNRETLIVGGGLEGPMGDSGWILDADFSYFDVLEDETRTSRRNPADPTYDLRGRVKEFEDTGWTTFDLKARTDRFMNRSDMNFIGGYHYQGKRIKYLYFTVRWGNIIA